VPGNRSISETTTLTVEDMVKLFQLPSRQAAYDRLKRGLFPRPFRLGRTLLWRPEDVEAFIEANLDEPQDQGGGGRS